MKGENGKILYLDFDGVLHPNEVYKYKKEVRMDYRGHSLFEWNDILEDILDNYPDLKIVLSTTWVRMTTFHKSKKRLPASVQEKVIGATYHSCYKKDSELYYEFPTLSRYESIKRDVHRRKPSRWIALDDDNEYWHESEKGKLILCHPDRGISSEITQRRLIEGLDKLFEVRGVSQFIKTNKP